MSNADFQIRSGGRPAQAAVDDNAPLTDSEYRLTQRILGDPFSFPDEYKSWLISYLEMSDMSLPMSAIAGLQRTLGITGAGKGTLGIFPAGVVLPYAGPTAPTGSLICDGAAYPKASQQRLFDAIGYNYGGSGASFNVPDLRGRVPVGYGPNGHVNSLGASEGVALDQRSPFHRTSDGGGAASEGITAGGDAQVFGSTPGAEIGVHHHGPDGTPVDTPAFLTITFIIVS